MERRIKVMLTFLALVILIAGLYTFTDWFSKVTGYFTGEGEINKLIICLNNNDAEFYTSLFCADCEKQQKLFGQKLSLIKQINCGNNKELCPNIKSIPAWYINGNIYYGYKDLNELKEIFGCE